MSGGFDTNIIEQARENGIPYRLLYQRVHEHGYPIEKAAVIPIRSDSRTKKLSRRIEHNGLCLTIREWSHRNNIPEDTIRRRLQNNWNEVRAITVPRKEKYNPSTPRNKLHRVGDKELTLKQWAYEVGVSYKALLMTISRTENKTLEEAVLHIQKRNDRRAVQNAR